MGVDQDHHPPLLVEPLTYRAYFTYNWVTQEHERLLLRESIRHTTRFFDVGDPHRGADHRRDRLPYSFRIEFREFRKWSSGVERETNRSPHHVDQGHENDEHPLINKELREFARLPKKQ